MEGIRKCIELNMRYYYICDFKLQLTKNGKLRISLRFRFVSVFVPLCFVARKRNGNFFLSATVILEYLGLLCDTCKAKQLHAKVN